MPQSSLHRISVQSVCGLPLLLVVISSIVATTMAAANDDDAATTRLSPIERQNILESLKDRTLKKDNFGPSDILEYLQQVGAEFVDQDLGKIGHLIDVANVSEDKCTRKHSQYLIRLLVNFHMTPLGAYIDSYRDEQKALCSRTYTDRLDRAIKSIDETHKARVQGLLKNVRLGGESARRPGTTVSLTGFSLEDDPSMGETIIGALKQYDQNVQLFISQGIADKSERQYAEQLREACHSVATSLEDFLWMLKILDTGAVEASRLQTDHEHREWLEAAKVCSALEADQLSRSIRERLRPERALVDQEDLSRLRAFGKYLTADTVKEGKLMARLDELTVSDSREALTRYLNGQKAQQNRHGLGSFYSLDDDLETSCEHVIDQLGPYLWLLNKGYGQGLDETLIREYFIPLKACQHAVLA